MGYMNKTNLTWAEINLSALSHNLEMVRRQLNVKTRIMAVVKANAYGHGVVEISKALVDFGVAAIAVATVGEAAELRKNQIDIPILLLGTVAPKDYDDLFEQGLVPTLNNYEMAIYLNECGRKRGQKIMTHLRIDTGMGSYGLLHGECLQYIDKILEMEYLELGGLYTHINTIYGGRPEDAIKQVNSFDNLMTQLRNEGVNIPVIHACSSPAVLKLPQAEYDMVRLGIVLYGLPCGNEYLDGQIKAVMQIKTTVVAIKEVESDFRVGYGSTFTTTSPARIATLALGYADANFLHFLQEGEVLIRSQRAPIIGKSCMDHLIVNVSHIKDVALGDEAVILGEQGDEKITVEEIAKHSGICMDNCDLVCLLSSRVPRVYIK
jgi:alanine racemase